MRWIGESIKQWADRLTRARAPAGRRLRQGGFLLVGWRKGIFGSRFRPQDLFRSSEPGFHFEVYDPNSLLRRVNRLTYSSKFATTTGGWTRAAILSVTEDADGTGDLVVPTNVATAHTLAQANCSAGAINIAKIKAKPGGYSFVYVTIGTASAWVNVTTGAQGTVGAGLTQSAPVAAGGGYYEWTVYGAAASTNFAIGVSAADNTASFAGDGVSGVYLARAQLEWNTTTASTYQEVTDWSTEYRDAVLESIAMWQDSAGVAPVTAVEQPVGLWFDKRLTNTFVRVERASDVEFNTGFGAPGSSTQWAPTDASTSMSGGVVQFTATPSGHGIRQDCTVVGRWYEATINISAISGTIRVVSGATIASTSSVGVFRCIYQAGSAIAQILTSGVATATLTSASFKEIGVVGNNHASQATAGSRPTLSARYNLRTKTEQFNDAAWTKTDTTVTANQIADPLGFTTVDLLTEGSAGTAVTTQSSSAIVAGTAVVESIALKRGNTDWVRVMVGATSAFADGFQCWVNLATGSIGTSGAIGTGTLTSVDTPINLGGGLYRITLRGIPSATATASVIGICSASADNSSTRVNGATYYSWGADCRTANDAALAQPTYQRVNTTSDYDTSGFVHYLSGITDDGFLTPSIDATAYNKVFICVPLTKRSDAAAAAILESSATSSGNNGTIAIFNPAAAGATYTGRSKGTAAADALTAGSYTAPNTAVLAFLGDIASDGAVLRVNGTQVATSATDQGTGNYGNYVHYLFRRNNATLPSDARVTSMTVRYSTTPTSDARVRGMEQYAARLSGQSFASS